MKVLQVITHLELGGAQKATLDLSRWLLRKGYDVVIISSSRGFLYKSVKKEFGKRFKESKFLRREINPVYDLIGFFSLLIFILENKFDVVHTHTSKAGILGRWAVLFTLRTKSVHTVHGFAFHDFQNLILKHIFIIVEKITAIITNKIIAVSKSVKDKGLKYGIGSEKKYSVVYELVNTGSNNDRLTLESREHNRRASYKIGMIAALKQQKNPGDFIKIASILLKKRKDLEFLLIGDGVLRNKLNKMIKMYNIEENFKILGWREDAYALMESFDVLILTSLFEGQPHVIIEAMSLGIPIVATEVDGVKDLIKNGENGFLFPPRNPHAAVRCVENILDNTEVRNNISMAAWNYFKNEKKMDYILNLGKIEKIYQEIVYESDRNY
ncbi:MAG: glycosyltransferase family 4 protein [Candidatus Saelkia tenebricola]|nr:glycosyltransferase family 4 protein [Candidatus Saelkia tenebricola]